MFHVKFAKIDNLSKICVALTILTKKTLQKINKHFPFAKSNLCKKFLYASKAFSNFSSVCFH